MLSGRECLMSEEEQEQIVNSIFAKHRACRKVLLCLKAKAKDYAKQMVFIAKALDGEKEYRVVETGVQIEYMGVVRTDEDLTHPLKCPSMEEIVTILNQITEADNELKARTKQLEELGYGEYVKTLS